MYTSDFWQSTICFQVFALVGFLYLVTKNIDNSSLISFLPYFIFGLAKWTLIEYYFHRFLLHQDLQKKPILDHHLMHHVFPNMRNKLALSISQIVIYMVGFYFAYSLFLGKDQTISLLLGVLVGLTLYDITHYYFHFGPEINIPFLINLRRNHLKHHYRDPNRGFGVSNTFWDKIFGSEHKN